MKTSLTIALWLLLSRKNFPAVHPSAVPGLFLRILVTLVPNQPPQGAKDFPRLMGSLITPGLGATFPEAYGRGEER